MQQSGENQSAVKEMMQKVAAKFEEKWDINKNTKFEDKWDINKNTKFEDKYINNKNTKFEDKYLNNKNTKFEDKWDINKNTKFEDKYLNNKNLAATEQAQKRDIDNASPERQRNAGDDNNSRKHESSHRTSESENPYVLAPDATSQSGPRK